MPYCVAERENILGSCFFYMYTSVYTNPEVVMFSSFTKLTAMFLGTNFTTAWSNSGCGSVGWTDSGHWLEQRQRRQ